jgi:hypothetical protein
MSPLPAVVFLAAFLSVFYICGRLSLRFYFRGVYEGRSLVARML